MGERVKRLKTPEACEKFIRNARRPGYPELALEGPYKPIPKGVFLMLQPGKGTSQIEAEMDNGVSIVLAVI